MIVIILLVIAAALAGAGALFAVQPRNYYGGLVSAALAFVAAALAFWHGGS